MELSRAEHEEREAVIADQRVRQAATNAEREPNTVAFALAAFRKRRGFDRTGLAAWLRVPPDRLPALAIIGRPDPSTATFVGEVGELAARFGADPGRLAEALA